MDVFQGGTAFQVYNPQGSKPLESLKVAGGSVRKEYDKPSKSQVIVVDQPTSKITVPKVLTGALLVHPIVVVQVYAIHMSSISIEFSVVDALGKRRLMFSNNFSSIQPNPQHTKFPFQLLPRQVWVDLVFDVRNLHRVVYEARAPVGFRGVESITISGAGCRVRRIFTLRELPIASATVDGSSGEPTPVALSDAQFRMHVPSQFALPNDVDQVHVLIRNGHELMGYAPPEPAPPNESPSGALGVKRVGSAVGSGRPAGVTPRPAAAAGGPAAVAPRQTSSRSKGMAVPSLTPGRGSGSGGSSKRFFDVNNVAEPAAEVISPTDLPNAALPQASTATHLSTTQPPHPSRLLGSHRGTSHHMENHIADIHRTEIGHDAFVLAGENTAVAPYSRATTVPVEHVTVSQQRCDVLQTAVFAQSPSEDDDIDDEEFVVQHYAAVARNGSSSASRLGNDFGPASHSYSHRPQPETSAAAESERHRMSLTATGGDVCVVGGSTTSSSAHAPSFPRSGDSEGRTRPKPMCFESEASAIRGEPVASQSMLNDADTTLHNEEWEEATARQLRLSESQAGLPVQPHSLFFHDVPQAFFVHPSIAASQSIPGDISESSSAAVADGTAYQAVKPRKGSASSSRYASVPADDDDGNGDVSSADPRGFYYPQAAPSDDDKILVRPEEVVAAQLPPPAVQVQFVKPVPLLLPSYAPDASTMQQPQSLQRVSGLREGRQADSQAIQYPQQAIHELLQQAPPMYAEEELGLHGQQHSILPRRSQLEINSPTYRPTSRVEVAISPPPPVHLSHEGLGCSPPDPHILTSDTSRFEYDPIVGCYFDRVSNRFVKPPSRAPSAQYLQHQQYSAPTTHKTAEERGASPGVPFRPPRPSR